MREGPAIAFTPPTWGEPQCLSASAAKHWGPTVMSSPTAGRLARSPIKPRSAPGRYRDRLERVWQLQPDAEQPGVIWAGCRADVVVAQHELPASDSIWSRACGTTRTEPSAPWVRWGRRPTRSFWIPRTPNNLVGGDEHWRCLTRRRTPGRRGRRPIAVSPPTSCRALNRVRPVRAQGGGRCGRTSTALRAESPRGCIAATTPVGVGSRSPAGLPADFGS